jgi:phage terminase small subunit
VLNPKQQRFVAEYLIDLNATQAAIRAGYSKKTAKAQGSRLLTHVDVAAAVASGAQKQLQTADLTAARVLEEYRRLAFCDLRAFFDEHGNMKAIKDLDAEQGAVLAGMEVVIKNAEAGDGVIDRIHKFKVWDKTKALGDLAKYFGLHKEHVEHSGAITLKWADE